MMTMMITVKCEGDCVDGAVDIFEDVCKAYLIVMNVAMNRASKAKKNGLFELPLCV
jgi:hypothetical protein